VVPKYPDVCLQTFTSSWWVQSPSADIGRGRLIWTSVPYTEMKPYRLVPIGRGDSPRQHSAADFRIETFRVGDPPQGIASLPVAALPIREGEDLIVSRAKRRPALVISTGGPPIPPELRRGASRWQSAPAILVAPYYGAKRGPTRGGWSEPFVDRIRRAEYPQYLWDILPLGAADEPSILRLDNLMAVGADSANWMTEPWCLSSEALGLLDEVFVWLMTGKLTEQTALGYARTALEAL
jgi:hypothetical protein